MMKGVLVLFFLVFSITVANAQSRINEKKYDVKNYSYSESDRFEPAMAGVLAIIPGLGHLYTGQPLRGLAFIGGMGGSLFLSAAGFAVGWGGQNDILGASMMLGGVFLFTGIYVWNFFDAVKVAKIRNMVFRDSGVSFNFKPFINNSNNQLQSNSAGLSLQLNF